MSNHWHAIVTDPRMKVAEFYGWVHKYVAKAVNCATGRWENLWSPEKTNVIPLESPEDIFRDLEDLFSSMQSKQVRSDSSNVQ